MADLEKVKKGLKVCFESKTCDGCPYGLACKEVPGRINHEEDWHCPILDDVLELLNESVLIEPLCEFLAEYVVPPQSLGWGFTTEECKQAWREFIQNEFSR